MKKVIRFSLVLVVLIFLVLLLVPYLFKDTLFQLVKDEANKNLKGELFIEDLNVSLLKDFPNLSMELKDVRYNNEAPFEDVTLFDIDKLSVEIDLFSAFSEGSYKVESIRLLNPIVDVRILENGISNYDIMVETEEAEIESPASESENFELTLKNVEVDGLNLRYVDLESFISLDLEKFNLDLSGNFTDDVVNINTKSDWGNMTLDYDGMKYLNRVEGASDFDMVYTSSSEKLEFGENFVSINNLKLIFSGGLAFLPNGYNIDLAYATEESTFKDLMSLIPAIYTTDLDKVKSEGVFTMNGFVKGDYLDDSEDIPSFSLNLNVKDGSFDYEDLPASIQSVFIDLKLDHPGGLIDNVGIDMNRFDANIAGNPLKAKLILKDPMADPYIEGMVNCDIDLSKWDKIIPLEEPLNGFIKADAQFKGRQSAFENSDFNKASAEGIIEVRELDYYVEDFGIPLFIENMKMEMSPNLINMPVLSLRTANSDLSGTGVLKNAFSWFMSDEPLSGTFDFTSNKLDINEFLTEEEVDVAAEEGVEEPLEVIRIPKNINMRVKLSAKELQYTDMLFSDAMGTMVINDGKLRMDPLNLKYKGGEFAMNGGYDSNPESPLADFSLTIKEIPFKEAINFSFIEEYLPIAKNIIGNLNSNLSFNAILGQDMMPILSSLSSKGQFKTLGLAYSSSALNQVNQYFKSDDLSKVSFSDPNLSFEIKDGTASVKPIRLKLGGQSFTFSGSHNLEQQMAYELNTKVPVSGLNLPKELDALGLTTNSNIDLKLMVGGTISNPKITPKFGDIEMKDVVNTVINTVKDTVVTTIKKNVDEEVRKIMADAQAQSDKIMTEARAQAANIKAEAKKQADSLKSEAQKQADKLVADAKDPLAKLAAKTAAEQVMKEANKQIDKLNQEANKQADAVISEAQKQSDKIMADAQVKADALTK